MDNDRKHKLVQRAELAERAANRMKEPYVKETMHALAVLYRDLAEQLDQLEELRARALVLSYLEGAQDNPGRDSFAAGPEPSRNLK